MVASLGNNVLAWPAHLYSDCQLIFTQHPAYRNSPGKPLPQSVLGAQLRICILSAGSFILGFAAMHLGVQLDQSGFNKPIIIGAIWAISILSVNTIDLFRLTLRNSRNAP